MKKNIKVLALVLASSGLLLTSCGDETFYPTLDFSENKIDNGDSQIFTKDELTKIYEKLHDSSTSGQEIRDIIIDSVADHVIGSFKIIGSEIKLVGYDIDEDGKAITDTATQLEFVKKHNAYWNKVNDKGKYVPQAPTTALDESIKNRINVIKDIVKEEIVTKLFDEANSDLYKDHHYFDEVKFAREKFKTSSLNILVDGKGFSYENSDKNYNIYEKKWESDYSKDSQAGTQNVFYNNVLIDSHITKEKPDTVVKEMLHLDYYEDYINKEILPSIVDTLLVEQYVYDNQYISLSRTQARKVNYVSIQATESNNDRAKKLVNYFVKNNIVKATDEEPAVNFDELTKAWKGLPEAKELIKASDAFTEITTHDEAIGAEKETGSSWFGFTEQDVTDLGTFYKETEFGQLMLDYAKINDNRNDSESNSKYKDFTNSGKYSATKGLDYKVRDIKVKDYTTTAWGTKDNGFSSLPSNIKDALFEYSVSTDIEVKKVIDDKVRDKGHVILYRGHYFLKNPKTPLDPSLEDLIVHYDEGSKTFYIVEVLEALSQSKLMYDSTDGYDSNKREQISREIGYDIASTDTYKNTAYNKYLEACDIKYHDQSIYDYMKETYPDLFEEEK